MKLDQCMCGAMKLNCILKLDIACKSYAEFRAHEVTKPYGKVKGTDVCVCVYVYLYTGILTFKDLFS